MHMSEIQMTSVAKRSRDLQYKYRNKKATIFHRKLGKQFDVGNKDLRTLRICYFEN